MTFVSYAQNLEDVMLFRALKDIEKGFYIDVGAQDPITDSVTKAFYERGWRGINIEPSKNYYSKLAEDRPEDINRRIAIGSEIGKVAFYEFLGTGLSTTKKEYISKHVAGGFNFRERRIDCTTLDAICREHQVEEVHFLKIDVEGAEREVLEGFSFTRVRPWIVVIKATAPNSAQDTSSDWEDLILEKKYEFVYFDGLNRYYIAGEHKELAEHFDRPPNCFDDYITYDLWWYQKELARLSQERPELLEQLQMLSNSLSWKMTAPLRLGKRILLAMMRAHFRVARWGLSLFHRLSIKIFRVSLNGALRFVWLRKIVRPFSNRFPRFKERVLRMGNIGVAPFRTEGQFFEARKKDRIETQLPETARRIYFELKQQCADLENQRANM